MKRFIKSNTNHEHVTNNYINALFKKIDWDDVDWADRLIDKTIHKAFGVDINKIFDQAEYINMLDKDTRDKLMSLLEDPEALHEYRMKNKKKPRQKKSGNSSKQCTLSVKFEDYPDGNVANAEFSGSNRLEALKALVENLLLYIDVNQIEDDEMTSEEIIESIESNNGDGCDYIIELVDKGTGEFLIDNPYDEQED